MATLATAWLFDPLGNADDRTIARERISRRLSYARGQPLPATASDVSTPLEQRLARAGFRLGSPLFIRIYKREFELEVWLEHGGKFNRFATYPICYFSGRLGPKLRQGDRQSPEGIYNIEARQLNPASRWHRAFNLGFPNRFDRAHGRTGTFLMVHGGCSSVGCYAMTNPAIDEIYRLAAAAIAGGQSSFQVMALPFRMTPDALTKRAASPDAPFWSDLKSIADAFDTARVPPRVSLCNGRYRLTQLSRKGIDIGCRTL